MESQILLTIYAVKLIYLPPLWYNQNWPPSFKPFEFYRLLPLEIIHLIDQTMETQICQARMAN